MGRWWSSPKWLLHLSPYTSLTPRLCTTVVQKKLGILDKNDNVAQCSKDFFFNVAHFEWFSRAKIRLILTSFWHASNIFVKIFGVILEFLQNSYNLFRAKMILLTVNLFTYTERVHNSLTITLLSHLWSFSLRICACFQAPTMPTGLRTLGAFNCKKLNFE